MILLLLLFDIDGIARNIGHQRNIQTTLDNVMEMRDDESEGFPDFVSDDVSTEVKSSKEYSVAESARALRFT